MVPAEVKQVCDSNYRHFMLIFCTQFYMQCMDFSVNVQCFNGVGWATGKAPSS